MNFNDEACITIDLLLQDAYSKLAKAKGQQFSSQGLTSQQVSILLLLDQKGPMRVSNISAELKMVDSNVSNICSRLEKACFVRRKRLKDDRRVVIIELTDSAMLKMEDIKLKVNNFRQKLSEQMAQDDLKDICSSLLKLNDLLNLFLEPAVKSE